MRTLLRTVVTAGGLTIATSSAVIALGNRSPKMTSYATTSPGFAVLSSLTGAALLAAAAYLAYNRAGTRIRAALATFALGTVWSADAWTGWSGAPTVVRAAGMLLIPMLAPAALLTIGSILGGRAAVTAVVAAGAGIASAVALWLVRDPFLDRYCWRDCLVPSVAPFAGAEIARTATNIDLGISVVCGALAAVLCARALARSSVWPSVPGLAAGCALAASSLVLRFEPAEDPTRPLYGSLFVARSLSLLVLAAALGYIALRPTLLRRAISRLASDPGRAGDGLEAALGAATGVRGIRLGYPLPAGGRVVDAEGRPVELEPTAARIVRGGEVVALVHSPVGVPPASALERALGPGARLALANERLRAEQLFRLHELTELRRRIVVTRDATRRRLERDLHDGAQQRLLTLAIDLRIAVKRADSAARPQAAGLLREAAALVDETTRELRAIAHGIFPTSLASAGLAAALESLADERPLVLSIGLEPGRRFPAEVEAAAYALVAETTDGFGFSSPARVRVEEADSKLTVALEGAILGGGASFADDRVGAAGGTLVRTGRRLEAIFPTQRQ
ncbi:MAG: histidine kinase [Gaiellaceae bacterium]